MSVLSALETDSSDGRQADDCKKAGLSQNLRLFDIVRLPGEDIKRLVCEVLWDTERPGIAALVMAMGHDYAFFTSPASARYHSANEGGLALHSLLVYYLLRQKNELFGLGLSRDSLAITGICHDLCKAGTYEKVIKSRKEGTKVNGWGKTVANWVDYESYEVQDSLPIGHGEKSVIMLQRYIELTDQETAMIVGHMGGFDERHNVFSRLAALWPAVAALHAADLEAPYILETREQKPPASKSRVEEEKVDPPSPACVPCQ